MTLTAVCDFLSMKTVPANQAAQPKNGTYNNDFFASAPVGDGAT